MRKKISTRRQKVEQNKKQNEFNEIQDVLINESNTLNSISEPDLIYNHLKELEKFNQVNLSLLEINEKVINLLNENRNSLNSNESIEKISIKLRIIEEMQDKILFELKKNSSDILVLKERSDLSFLADRIISDIRKSNKENFDQLKLIFKKDINLVIDFLMPQKSQKDIERTISYQLGKNLIDSKKSIKSILSLPLSLYLLKKESNLRRNKKIINIDGNKLDKKTMVDYLNYQGITEIKKINKFDGDILEYLGITTHKLFNIKKSFNLINIQSNENISQPRYFNSDILIKIDELKYFLDANSFMMTSDVSSNGLEIDIIFNFYSKEKERILFKVVKSNLLNKLLVPKDADYFSMGVKIYGNGSLEISNARIIKDKDLKTENNKLEGGISILMPSYRGERYILDALNSIKNQINISYNDFEVIIVINGIHDNSKNIIENFSKNNRDIKIKLLFSEEASASSARNIAINNATKEFSIFLDDDDLLSPNYLEKMYEISHKDTMVISYINDLDSNNIVNKETAINLQLKEAVYNPNHNNCSSAITMIASKMIPTENLKKLKFNSNLKSGEDVCFFNEYILKFQPQIKIVEDKNCAYIRRLRENSVSRQILSFNFNVEQRLDVIKDLESKSLDLLGKVDNFTLSKIKAQTNFIIKYLEKNPLDEEEVINKIISQKIINFPYDYFWEKLDKKNIEQLVISYCYPPFVDTSATIVAKRVNQFGKISDIVANNMSKNRGIDDNIIFLNKHYINKTYYINSPTSFGNWSAIKAFVEQTMIITENKFYKQLYSRVLWPASNFAACMYKLRNPKTKWIAEFSDPVILDIQGNIRYSELNDDLFLETVMAFMKNEDCEQLCHERNLYVWCELIAYLFADEIIFTCDSQKKLMLNTFPYPNIIKNIQNKIKISPHPIPKEIFYEIGDVKYTLDEKNVNFGYFGVFYKNRKLTALTDAVIALKKSTLNFKIHIFTNSVNEVKSELSELELDDYFIVNEYLNYFDFLKMCKLMDVLIVNDTKASETFGFNPYLPSKLSDYLGSNSKIWAFVDDKTNIKDVEYISKLDDDVSDLLASIVKENLK